MTKPLKIHERGKWVATAHWFDGSESQSVPMSLRDVERWVRNMRDVALVRSVDSPVRYSATKAA